MTKPARIDPDSVYDDAALCHTLPVTWATLAKGRKAGSLRFARKGNRNFYFGRWVIDWLESSAAPIGRPREEAELMPA